MSVTGKVAIVTGAVRGMGKAYVMALLEEGAKGVTLVNINEDKGKQTSEELGAKYGNDRVLYVQCDVTILEQLRNVYHQTLERFGQCDIVINNAGILDEINYERTIAVNLTATITSSYMAVSHMRKDRGGNGGIIINISSIAATSWDGPFLLVYTATKHGILAFTKALAKTMEDINIYGVMVTSILPCKVYTEMPDFKMLRNLQPTREEDVTQPLIQESAKMVATCVEEMPGLLLPPVAKAMLELVSEPDCNGAVLELSAEGFAKYLGPDHLVGKTLQLL